MKDQKPIMPPRLETFVIEDNSSGEVYTKEAASIGDACRQVLDDLNIIVWTQADYAKQD